MTGYIEGGARVVKMKIGGATIDEDVRRVEIVRKAIGEGFRLLVDANNAYTVFEAIQVARRLEPLGVYWFEEPVMPDDYGGLRWIGAATTIPTASGENEYTRYGFRDLLTHGEPSIVNADAQFLGGVTELMKVAALTQAHDIHVHLATAIPNGLLVEYNPPDSDPLVTLMQADALPVVEGFVSPPNRPGVGLVLDEKALERHRMG